MVEVDLGVVQEKILKEMVPVYGKDESEVLKNIFIMFIHKEAANIEEVLFIQHDLLEE